MPTYQYACTACAEQLEVVQSFSDSALTECPSCQGTLRKKYGAVGVVFKGSGFYKTDSRSEGKKSVTADAGSSKTKSESTTAAAPAAKSESTSSSSTSTPVAKSA